MVSVLSKRMKPTNTRHTPIMSASFTAETAPTFLNSRSSAVGCPICWMALLKASCASVPDSVCPSIASRRWVSNSSSTLTDLIPPAANRRRQSTIARSRLNILLLPQLFEQPRNGYPLVALLLQRLLSIRLERIVFAFTPGLGFPPSRLNPALALHAVQHGIEHSVGPFDLVSGKPFHL